MKPKQQYLQALANDRKSVCTIFIIPNINYDFFKNKDFKAVQQSIVDLKMFGGPETYPITLSFPKRVAQSEKIFDMIEQISMDRFYAGSNQGFSELTAVMYTAERITDTAGLIGGLEISWKDGGVKEEFFNQRDYLRSTAPTAYTKTYQDKK